MKKAAFFDIDGTLWDRDAIIPDSTREAIRQLRENGVHIFINSGRTTAFIKNPSLLELGFDGILAGCGTYVSLEGREICSHKIEPTIMKKTVDILRKYDLPAVLEGETYQYIEESEFIGDPFLDMLKEEVGENLLSIYENDMKWEVSKLSFSIKNDNYRQALNELKEWYDFLVHGQVVVECVPKGFSKVSGIQVVCEKLGIERGNTYAFGDSVNDVEMLRYVAHGVAMGNGMEEAKAVADYVTDDLHADGIYNACKHYGLI